MVMNDISKGSCVSRGGGQHRIRKNWNSYIFFQRNVLMDIKISIIDICYSNTAPVPLMVWRFLYFINEKLNKNAKVEKLTKKLGRSVRLIVRGPFKYNGNTTKIPGIYSQRWMIFKSLQDWTSFLHYTCTRHYPLSYSRWIVMDVVLIISTFN